MIIRCLVIWAPLPLMINSETAPETSGRDVRQLPWARLAGAPPTALRHPVQVPSRAWDTETPSPRTPTRGGSGERTRPGVGVGPRPGKTAGRARGGGARGCPGWVGKAGSAGKAPAVWRIGNGLCSCAARWSSVSRSESGRERRRAGDMKGREAAPRRALGSLWPRGDVQ